MTEKKDAFMLARIAEACEYNYEPRYFDFCDMAMQKKLIPVLNRSGVSYSFFGGTPEAERKMLCIYPEYVDEQELVWPMAALRFRADFPIDHRNVLGELMASGITRECLGDISVSDGEVQVIFSARLLPFFRENITKFKGRSVKIEWLGDHHDIKSYPIAYKAMSIVTASDRVDGLIGKIWGFSRQDALEMIKQKRLRLNGEAVLKNDHRFEAGDVLSLRGKGKAKVAEISNSKTKKGNLRVAVWKYI